MMVLAIIAVLVTAAVAWMAWEIMNAVEEPEEFIGNDPFWIGKDEAV